MFNSLAAREERDRDLCYRLPPSTASEGLFFSSSPKMLSRKLFNRGLTRGGVAAIETPLQLPSCFGSLPTNPPYPSNSTPNFQVWMMRLSRRGLHSFRSVGVVGLGLMGKTIHYNFCLGTHLPNPRFRPRDRTAGCPGRIQGSRCRDE